MGAILNHCILVCQSKKLIYYGMVMLFGRKWAFLLFPLITIPGRGLAIGLYILFSYFKNREAIKIGMK